MSSFFGPVSFMEDLFDDKSITGLDLVGSPVPMMPTQYAQRNFKNYDISLISLPTDSALCAFNTLHPPSSFQGHHCAPNSNVVQSRDTIHSGPLNVAPNAPSTFSDAWSNVSLPTSTHSNVPTMHAMVPYCSTIEAPSYISPRELSGQTISAISEVPDCHNHDSALWSSINSTTPYSPVMGNIRDPVQYPANAPLSHWQPHASPAIGTSTQSNRANLRGNRSMPNPPRTPRRTSSLPVSPLSPTNFSDAHAIHTCLWVHRNGLVCGLPITVSSLSEHLAEHGIANMASGCAVRCGWMGCRVKGNKGTVKRESIVRHVREKHLGGKRAGTH